MSPEGLLPGADHTLGVHPPGLEESPMVAAERVMEGAGTNG